MNILIVSYADNTGAGYALMQAINQHTEHQARHIKYHQTVYEHPTDMFKPGKKRVLNLARWADVVNVHDDGPFAKCFRSKPVVMTYHGSYYRRNADTLNKRDKKRRYKQLALTLTLAQMHSLPWIGRAMPDLSHMHKPIDEFTVHHCATNTRKKGTKAIRGALEGIPLQIITQTANATCLAQRAECHAVVERFKGTYGTIGTTALESFSMGLPVVSWASPERLAYIKQVIGYVPFIQADGAEQLRQAIERLRDDTEYYQHWQQLGRRYVKQWHDPKIIAEKFVRYCGGN